MDKQKLIELGVSEESVEAILTAIEADKKEALKEYIPKARFNEVIEAKNKLETELSARDKQLDELKNVSTDIEGYKGKIAELQAINKKARDEHEAQIRGMKIDNLIKDGFLDAKLADPRFLQGAKAYLDMTKITLDGDKLVGFKEQLDSIKTSIPAFFKSDEVPPSTTKGFVPADSKQDDAVTAKEGTYEWFLAQASNKN